MKKSIIVVTSEHYSGKTTFTKIARERYDDDCQVYQGRAFLEDLLNKKGIPITRESVRNEGQRTIEDGVINNVPGILSLDFMSKIDSSFSRFHIIDSVYHPIQIPQWKTFANNRGYFIYVVAIQCDAEQRLFNARIRHESFSEQDLAEVDALERTNIPNGQRIDVCMEMADIEIFNNSTLEHFVSNIKKFFTSIE